MVAVFCVGSGSQEHDFTRGALLAVAALAGVLTASRLLVRDVGEPSIESYFPMRSRSHWFKPLMSMAWHFSRSASVMSFLASYLFLSDV